MQSTTLGDGKTFSRCVISLRPFNDAIRNCGTTNDLGRQYPLQDQWNWSVYICVLLLLSFIPLREEFPLSRWRHTESFLSDLIDWEQVFLKATQANFPSHDNTQRICRRKYRTSQVTSERLRCRVSPESLSLQLFLRQSTKQVFVCTDV